MLNISINSVNDKVDRDKYSALKRVQNRSSFIKLLRVLLLIAIVAFASLFLPWTQNIRSYGYVTTLNPFDKPQDVQSLISGKIEKWYVQEGQIVNAGDTIAVIQEAKAEYLDPDIIDNTKDQQSAKVNSANAYADKIRRLNEQAIALEENYNTKVNQLKIKQEQLALKIQSDSLKLEAAKVYLTNATNQLKRMETMYQQGVKPLKDLEEKRLSERDANAKKIEIENNLSQYANENRNILQEFDFVKTDFLQKKAKIQSDIQTSDSYRFSLLGETSKLQSKINQLEQRKIAYAIVSPIRGTVTKILKNGIGEFIKEQESITTIVPLDFQRAVELYIEPNDMPLIQKGKKVRLQFDGWPAIVFSGWPNNSFGTFEGQVFAIDNDISENGKYRILVTEDSPEKPWPDLVRIGSGANGILLLNEVRVYYEIWRQLNGFPADFYEPNKDKRIKNKSPGLINFLV
ncbi:MAG: HlyD family efflux transporter periplasmic adaptor subunit [Bacteroidota bacterium]